MNPVVGSEVQRLVASYVEERTGLSSTGAQGRRLREAVCRTLADPDPDSGQVGTGAPLSEQRLVELCEELTVQESYFFREPGKLSLIEQHVVPRVRGRRTPLRVWSAGCANGEEVYTVADVLSNAGLTGRYQILGTDLSEAALAAARAGSYSKWSVRGLGAEQLSQLFDRTGSRYRVVDRLRSDVTFEQHNLLDPVRSSWRRFDLVLCRNVLIYFTPTAARAVIARLTESLAPGGWLLLGVSDPIADDTPGLETVITDHGLAYRRRASGVDPGTEPSGPGSPTAGADRIPRRARRRTPPPVAGGAEARAVRSRAHGPRIGCQPGTTESLRAAEEALRLARPVEAERLARSLLDAAPRMRSGHLLLVQALAEQGRPHDAEAAAARAVSLFPEDAEARYLQSVVLLERGNPTNAAAVARQAIYLDPGHAPSHLVLSRAYELVGEHAAAERARAVGCRILAQGTPP